MKIVSCRMTYLYLRVGYNTSLRIRKYDQGQIYMFGANFEYFYNKFSKFWYYSKEITPRINAKIYESHFFLIFRPSLVLYCVKKPQNILL